MQGAWKWPRRPLWLAGVGGHIEQQRGHHRVRWTYFHREPRSSQSEQAEGWARPGGLRLR
jgi:hypothetical protein